MNETYTLPPSAPHANHGKTTASWVFTIGSVIGALIIAVGIAMYQPVAQIAGIGVLVLAALAGLGLRAAGKGQPREKTDGAWYR
ncbi:MAG: HGxxPAAW family protein [Bowdeniella nasicola]|nr:HGxxPAAW family protein [Bowdeniella nasicola]